MVASTAVRLGYTTWSMPTVRAEEAIPLLAALGYDAIELAVVPGWRDALDLLTPDRRRRIARLLREHDLVLAALASNVDLLADDPRDLDENLAQLANAIDLAAEWAGTAGPPVVDTYLGGRPGDWPGRREMARERLTRVCERGATRGVTIALQPHMDGVLDSPDKVAWIVDAIARPNLGITLDINDFSVQGYDVAEVVALLGPHAVHAHVKDEVGRVPDYRFVVPGDGAFDYRRFIAEMSRVGYRGAICGEISLRVQRQPGYDPSAAAEQSYRVLSAAFAEAAVARAGI